MSHEAYHAYMDTFTAEDFDADAIVRMARDAGCRYITLTTRHHDGFSLYDTCGLSDFDVMHSPEFDGKWSKKDADWREDELYATIRKYQPEALIINNSGLGDLDAVGHPELDVVTYEGSKPSPLNREGMSKYLAIEMSEGITGYWGYAEWDLTGKSPKEHILSLCASRKVGANYCMNIGPMGQGKVEPYQQQVFAMVGRWMQLYGEAVYKGRPYNSHGMGQTLS